MAVWHDIEDNFNNQMSTLSAVAKSSTGDIRLYYKELYRKGELPFSNTIGSHLLADVATADRVLVDIYPWTTPKKIHSIYGVDYSFLKALRDKNLIVLCANAPIQDFSSQEFSWLYEILADERTIFRHDRTTTFFRTSVPDIHSRANEYSNRLRYALKKYSDPEIIKLCADSAAANPIQGVDHLSDYVGHYCARLDLKSKESDRVFDAILNMISDDPGPGIGLSDFLRYYINTLGDITTGLGSPWRMYFPRYQKIYIREDNRFALEKKMVTKIEEIQKYISELATSTNINDTASESYWEQLDHKKRDDMLSALCDKDLRRNVMLLESKLSAILQKEGAIPGSMSNVTKEDIRALVNTRSKQIDRIKDVLNIQFVIGVGGFIISQLHDNTNIDAYVNLAGTIIGYSCVRKPLEKVVSRVVPSMHVVKLVSSIKKSHG